MTKKKKSTTQFTPVFNGFDTQSATLPAADTKARKKAEAFCEAVELLQARILLEKSLYDEIQTLHPSESAYLQLIELDIYKLGVLEHYLTNVMQGMEEEPDNIIQIERALLWVAWILAEFVRYLEPVVQKKLQILCAVKKEKNAKGVKHESHPAEQREQLLLRVYEDVYEILGVCFDRMHKDLYEKHTQIIIHNSVPKLIFSADFKQYILDKRESDLKELIKKATTANKNAALLLYHVCAQNLQEISKAVEDHDAICRTSDFVPPQTAALLGHYAYAYKLRETLRVIEVCTKQVVSEPTVSKATRQQQHAKESKPNAKVAVDKSSQANKIVTTAQVVEEEKRLAELKLAAQRQRVASENAKIEQENQRSKAEQACKLEQRKAEIAQQRENKAISKYILQRPKIFTDQSTKQSRPALKLPVEVVQNNLEKLQEFLATDTREYAYKDITTLIKRLGGEVKVDTRSSHHKIIFKITVDSQNDASFTHEIVCGLLRPHSGENKVAGFELRRVQSVIKTLLTEEHLQQLTPVRQDARLGVL